MKYYEKMKISDTDPTVTNNGDYYFSISGSITEGWQIHYYRKLGWDSVTTLMNTKIVTHEELIIFLSEPQNLYNKGY